MNDCKALSGHADVGGIQKHSCGDSYPWVIYQVVDYGPPDGRELKERAINGEVRVRHPDGRDFLASNYNPNYSGGFIQAHIEAECKVERLKRADEYLAKVGERTSLAELICDRM